MSDNLYHISELLPVQNFLKVSSLPICLRLTRTFAFTATPAKRARGHCTVPHFDFDSFWVPVRNPFEINFPFLLSSFSPLLPFLRHLFPRSTLHLDTARMKTFTSAAVLTAFVSTFVNAAPLSSGLSSAISAVTASAVSQASGTASRASGASSAASAASTASGSSGGGGGSSSSSPTVKTSQGTFIGASQFGSEYIGLTLPWGSR